MTTRFTLYPAQDSESVRRVRSCTLTSGKLLSKGVDHYVMRAGVAYEGRVDYFGDSFDGYKYDLRADIPWAILSGGTVVLPKNHSVVLDVTANGLPPSLEGVTVTSTVRHDYSDPAQMVRDPESRAVLDAVANHLNAIRASDETVSLALPLYVERYGSTGEYHDVSTDAQDPASATFVNGNVSVTVYGTAQRPVSVMLVGNATAEALTGTEALGVAISDGTTDQNEQQGGSDSAGDIHHVSTAYATQVNANTTFTLRLRDVVGTNRVNYQSITAITSEI